MGTHTSKGLRLFSHRGIPLALAPEWEDALPSQALFLIALLQVSVVQLQVSDTNNKIIHFSTLNLYSCGVPGHMNAAQSAAQLKLSKGIFTPSYFNLILSWVSFPTGVVNSI